MSSTSAYANAGKSESAEMVFRAMYNEYQNGNKSVRPTRRTFNALLAAWSRSTTAADSERLKAILNIMEQIPKMVGLDIKPDVVSYNCLLGCLSRMNTDDARVRAENVLEEMERKASSENDDTIAPDKYSYTSVMKVRTFTLRKDVTVKCVDFCLT